MPELKTHLIDKLVRSAIDARDQAYAPHSHFYVGAALLIENGEIVSGCNVENASYSLSICAERVAASTAVAMGHRSWRAIAIASVGGVMPCGACRQFLTEFGTDVTVILVDVIDGSRRTRKLSQLLPDAFDRSSLPSHAE
jgi:cytidine deaminase